MTKRNLKQLDHVVCQRFPRAIEALVRAFQYTADAQADKWDFAVEMAQFRGWEMTSTDLRWFVKKGYVEHACEITVDGDETRRFRNTGTASFKKRTCFVLTQWGYQRALTFLNDHGPGSDAPAVVTDTADDRLCRDKLLPEWDADVRELRLNGAVVKHFKWQAVNQEIVLGAFQEDGWPKVIDDPLPPKEEHDTKRRLHDTIKSLNRNQKHRAIRFRGNGTGEGVLWEFVAGNGSPK